MFPALPIERFPARTLPALLRLSARRVPERCFVREITADQASLEPQAHTFADFERAVASTAQALSALGIGAGDRLLFLAENSYAWQVLAWAAQALRAVTCAAYSNLAPAAMADIARRVKPRCVFVSNEAQLGSLQPLMPALVEAGLTLMISPQALTSAPAGLRSCTIADLIATPFEPAVWEQRVDAVSPNDEFLLLFTSGTSGRQKGVRLAQDAFVRALEGGRSSTGMTEHDNGLMFLPFAHVAGQCQFALAVALGHSLIVVSRREDLQRAFDFGPTYVFAVPMLYEKLRARVLERIESMSFPMRGLLQQSFAALSQHDLQGSIPIRERLLRVLGRNTIGKRLRAQLGGQLRMVASGGALAPVELVRFFESIGIPFLSLYGMTETCGLISSMSIEGPRPSDSVGLTSPDLSCRIDETGELCLKGPLMMSGYIDTEDDRAAFDADGYFHTGDLVDRDPGTEQLRIVGRSKDLIVLSTGKKLSPEPLEARLTAEPRVQAAVLVGDGQPYVSAILFVGHQEHTSDRIAAGDDDLLATSRRQLGTCSEFERPKRLLVVHNAPSEFPEFVTPTFKLKRAAVTAYFAEAIEHLYAADSGSVTLYEAGPEGPPSADS
jgi:long-chain acyl-CoA synthetase